VRDTEWDRKTQVMEKWLRGWRCHRNFGLFDQGAIYWAPGLMAAGWCHLSLRGKRILAQELAGLIETALNWVGRGKGMQ